MSDNCPVCKTPWTETQLITSSIKHCTVCKEKADVIVAKYKQSQENSSVIGLPRDIQLDPNIWKIGYGYPMPDFSPRKDPNCPVVSGVSSTKRGNPHKTLQESRSVRKEIDYLYDKWKESKL